MKNKDLLEISKEDKLKALAKYLPTKMLNQPIHFSEEETSIIIGNRKFVYFLTQGGEIKFAEYCQRNGKVYISLLQPKQNRKGKIISTLKSRIIENKHILAIMGGFLIIASSPILLHATKSYAAIEETTEDQDLDQSLEDLNLVIDSTQEITELAQGPISETVEAKEESQAISSPSFGPGMETENIQPTTEATPETTQAEITYYNVPCPTDIQEFMYQKCREYQVPFQVAMAIAHQESDGNFNNHGKVSSTNDYGYMQINKTNHAAIRERFGYTSNDLLNDDYKNIEASIWLLSDICKMYDQNDFENIFGTYNGWKNWRKKPMSRNYVASCMRYVNEFYTPLEWDETRSQALTR